MHFRLILMAIVLVCLLPKGSAAQDIYVRNHFDADSLAVGEWVPFTLTARYPAGKQVFFPDSTFDFKPFEFRKKQYFTTRTDGVASYDSAVYWLTTFELDRSQQLKLPIFILQERDCLIMTAGADSIRLSYRVPHPPDSVQADKLPLKFNTAYERLSWLLNYPLYGIIGAVVVVLLVVSWLVFGKSIRRYFRLRKLSREYEAFAQSFGLALDQLSREFNARKAEETLVLWKSYMEHLDRQPFTKFTSREILAVAKDSSLADALKDIDLTIYGGRMTTADRFQVLRDYTAKQFEKRQTAVKHGEH